MTSPLPWRLANPNPNAPAIDRRAIFANDGTYTGLQIETMVNGLGQYCDAKRQSNEDFVMTAINAHHDLVRGCRAALAYLSDPPSEFPSNREDATKIIEDALRKAKAL